MAGNVHRSIKTRLGGVYDPAMQIVAVAKGHGVDSEIDLSESGAAFFNHGLQAARLADIELFKQLGFQRFGERTGVGRGLVVLVSHRYLAALRVDSLGHGIGDGLVIGDSGNQTFFTGQWAIVLGSHMGFPFLIGW